MKIPLVLIPAAAALLCSPANAAVIGINFGSESEAAGTAAYTTHNLTSNVTVGSWNNFTGDWSGNATTFSADGATVQLYYDSSNVWSNDAVPDTSANRGYLDDWNYNGGGGSAGLNAGASIMLGGLSEWLAATGMSSYQVIVLRSTDTTGGTFTDIRWGGAADEGGNAPVGWFVDPQPAAAWPVVGDFTGGNVIDGDLFLDGATRTGESAMFSGDLDNLIIQAGHANGNARGAISGLIIIGVPEPGAAVLTLLAAGMLSRRRRS